MGSIYFCESSGKTLYEWGKKGGAGIYIEHALSEMDTILDLKKKMMREGISGDKSKLSELSEYVVWFHEKDSPFSGISVVDFLKRVDIFKEDRTYIGTLWGKDRVVYVTLLKILPDKFRDDLLKRVGNLSSRQGQYSIENIDKNIELQDSLELPGEMVSYEDDYLFKMIFVDVVPSDGREWVNIDKIFNIFPLSDKIPFMMIESDGIIKRKVYRKMVDLEQVREWSRLLEEVEERDGKRKRRDISKGIHGISFKYKYVVSSIIFYLTIKIYPKGGVNVFYRTEHKSENLSKKNWDEILRIVQKEIIDRVNMFSISNATNIRRSLRSIKKSDMIIRTLTTTRKTNILNKSVSMSFGSFLRTKGLYYRVISSKKKGDSHQQIQFVRVKDYLSSDNILLVKTQLEYENRNNVIGYIAMLYMTTDEFVENMIKNAEVDRKEQRGVKRDIKGPVIQFNMKTGEITFVGVKSFSDADYMYMIFARTYWVYMNTDLDNSIKAYKLEFEKEDELDDEELFSDDENDWDADDWDADDFDDFDDLEQDDHNDNLEEITSKSIQDTTPMNQRKMINLEQLKPWSQNGSYRLERLKAFAPDVFKYKSVVHNKTVGFSNRCQPPELAHPIVVDVETMNSIERGKYKDSYTDSLEYLGNWYLACEYFCWMCMIPLRENDMRGVGESKNCPECRGKIVTKKVIKMGNASKKEYSVFMNKSEKEYRAFLGQKLQHPDNLLPICRYKFKTDDRNNIRKRREREMRIKQGIKKVTMSLYVKKDIAFPLNPGFFGSFDEVIHRLMNNPREIFTNSANSGNLKPDIRAFLRMGVDLKNDVVMKRSFLELVSYYYGTSSKEVLDTVKNNIKKIGIFLSLYDGGAVRMFEKDFEKDEEQVLFEKWLKNKEENYKGMSRKYKERIFRAMSSLTRMIDDPDIEISHTLFWGLFCHPGILFKDGLNMYILESKDDDIRYICPQSKCYFSGAKNVFVFTSIISGDYPTRHYEPIVLVATGEKGGMIHGYPKSIFSLKDEGGVDDIDDIVFNLRQSCGVIENEKYINYLTREGYFKNIHYIDEIISMANDKGIGIKGRVINHDINVDHILLEANVMVPVVHSFENIQDSKDSRNSKKGKQLKDTLVIYTREEVARKLPDLFKVLDVLNKLGIEVVSYTTDKETDELSGFVLKSNRTIPVKRASMKDNRELLKRKNIEYDERPFYFDLHTSGSKINDGIYWRRYNEFCFQLGQYLQSVK